MSAPTQHTATKRDTTTLDERKLRERLNVFLIYIMNGTSGKKFLLTLSFSQFVWQVSWEKYSFRKNHSW